MHSGCDSPHRCCNSPCDGCNSPHRCCNSPSGAWILLNPFQIYCEFPGKNGEVIFKQPFRKLGKLGSDARHTVLGSRANFFFNFSLFLTGETFLDTRYTVFSFLIVCSPFLVAVLSLGSLSSFFSLSSLSSFPIFVPFVRQ